MIIMKRYLFILISTLFVFSSCVKYEDGMKVYPAKEYIVASERGCWSNGNDGWEPYFFVKEKRSNTWKRYDRIVGFDNYEPGYEYRIKAEKIEDKSLLEYQDGPSPVYLRMIEVLSSEKKDTEGLPENYLRYSEELPPPSEYFLYH